MLEEYLKRLGFDTATAEGAKDGLEILATFEPEVVISDLRMPGVNGAELANEIRSNPKFKNIPMLAITASLEGGRKYDLSGFNDLLFKPVRFNELAKVLGRYFEFEQTDTAKPEETIRETITISEQNISTFENQILAELNSVICSGMVISKVKEIADNMEQFGIEHGESSIRELGEKLMVAASSFDVVRIENIAKELNKLFMK